MPGEAHPFGLAAVPCPSLYFCAYSTQWQTGDAIFMTICGRYNAIPWVTTGSWVNNQTTGTRPLLTFTIGSTWTMPAAPSSQATGVDWLPVRNIKPC
ncbi:hypothetical protein V6U77_08960 [Micromonospora sp. CPCC 205546]|uniref:hypothetical protein n=1 Tax=Micromonospora sp. CPCC 205546 TaxID=3122397 RepID=UPI002FEFF83B